MFDTRGILSTPASHVLEWLKTTGTAIKIAREPTNNKKYVNFSETYFTETTIFLHKDKYIEIKVSLKILSHVSISL